MQTRRGVIAVTRSYICFSGSMTPLTYGKMSSHLRPTLLPLTVEREGVFDVLVGQQYIPHFGQFIR